MNLSNQSFKLQMKINSLFIDNYKLLKNFSVNFRSDVSILIGINGSGKSSILEAIAQIFSDAFLNEKSKFGFRINYDLRLEEIIEQTATTSEFRTDYIRVEISAKEKDSELSFKVNTVDLTSNSEITIERREEIESRFNKFENILPSNIVIYYSGLSEEMKRICEPHDRILSRQYREGNTNAPRPVFYFEPALFDLILLSLLSFEYGDIPEFLFEKAKIRSLQSVQLRLKKPEWVKQQKIANWWGAKGEIKTFLDYLDSLGLPLTIEDISNRANIRGNVVIEAWQNEYLNISIIGQPILFQIRERFIEEKLLFKILNTLYIDGFLRNVEFSFANEAGKSFSVLSEGEQQILTIKGIIELITRENTLFLFDEPDTYLHPSWQRSLIENIIQFNEKNDQILSQFIITTHSPQLLSNANPEKSEAQILEDGEIVKITPKYYGKDISTILYEMMGVERRNKKVAKALSILFNLIEDEELNKAKLEYESLATLLGEDDPAIIRAKTQLIFLEEASNEKNK
jgi:predicted ATPase